jgi:hypothetical protein
MIDIPREWLRRTATPEDFERASLERKAAAFDLPFEKVAENFGARPFGALTDQWQNLVKQLTEEDELWFFSSPDDTFAKKLGCQGYAIVRHGVVRKTLFTLRT